MRVGRTQILGIILNKDQVIDDYDRNFSSDRKRKSRTTRNEVINRMCGEWFCDASSRRVVITDPLLRHKAPEIAGEEGNSEFKAKNQMAG